MADPTAARSAGGAPTVPTPHPPGLSAVLERNIRALAERKARERRRAGLQDRLADTITRFTGSMVFVYLHLLLFGGWIVANLRLVPGVPAWDESFVVLAMAASVEAIFLSTFVLISQNRMQAEASARADLDLQISLLAEHEITKLAEITAAIARALKVPQPAPGDMRDILQNVAPEAVLDEIDQHEPDD